MTKAKKGIFRLFSETTPIDEFIETEEQLGITDTQPKRQITTF